MKLKYFVKQGEYETENGWDGDYGEYIDFEPPYKDLEKCVKELVIKEYGENAWKLVYELDVVEQVAEFYIEQVKEYFEKKALLEEY